MAKNTLDAQIKALFSELIKRKAMVEDDEAKIKRSWKTNCSLTIEGLGQPINIQVATEQKLLGVYAHMLQVSDYKAEAATELNIKFDDEWGGFPTADWIMDFKKRIASIHIKTKKLKLAELESRLEAIVSPEQRREMELAAIMSEMD